MVPERNWRFFFLVLTVARWRVLAQRRITVPCLVTLNRFATDLRVLNLGITGPLVAADQTAGGDYSVSCPCGLCTLGLTGPRKHE